MSKITRIIDALGEEETRNLSERLMQQYNQFVTDFFFVPAGASYWGCENKYEERAVEALMWHLSSYETPCFYGERCDFFFEELYKTLPNPSLSLEKFKETSKKVFGDSIYVDLNRYAKFIDPDFDKDPKGWDDPELIFQKVANHPADAEEWNAFIKDSIDKYLEIKK